MSDRQDQHRNRSHSDHHSSNNNSNRELKFQNTDEQCSLKIERITDPDTYTDFEREVKGIGTTTKFYINKRSMTCVVTYSQQNHAIAALQKFQKMHWPSEKNGQRMFVKLLSNRDVSDEITNIQRAQNIQRPEQDKFNREFGHRYSSNGRNGHNHHHNSHNRRGDDYDRRRRYDDDDGYYSEERHSNKRDQEKPRSPHDNDKNHKNNKYNNSRSRSRSPNRHSSPEHQQSHFSYRNQQNQRRSPESYKRDNNNYNNHNNSKRGYGDVLRTVTQPGITYTRVPPEVAEYRQKFIDENF